MTFIGVVKVTEGLYVPVAGVYGDDNGKCADVTRWHAKRWYTAITELSGSGMTKIGVELAGCSWRQYMLMSSMVRTSIDDGFVDKVGNMLDAYPYSLCLMHRLMVKLDEDHNVSTILYKNKVVDDGTEDESDDVPDVSLDDILKWRDEAHRITTDRVERLRQDLFADSDSYQPLHARREEDEKPEAPSEPAKAAEDDDDGSSIEVQCDDELDEDDDKDDLDTQAKDMQNSIRSMTDRLNEIIRSHRQ